MHYQGEGGPQDFIQGRLLLEQAAAQGHANGMVNLSVMFASDEGVEQDLNEAMRWFLQAQALGVDVSQGIAEVIQIKQIQNPVSSKKKSTSK